MEKTVLVVSEDSEIIESLRSLLGSGYRFLEAPNIEESRINIDSEIVSMVIIDVKISRKVRPGTYKKYIKALMEKGTLVHILVEEKETSKEVANLIEISDDFSVKPPKLDELSSKLESLLHLKEVEIKVLKQYEKLHSLEEGLISKRKKTEYEAELIEHLRDFMLEMKAKMHKKNRELEESYIRLMEQTEKTRESEQYLQTMFNSITDIVVVVDSVGNILGANQTAMDNLGKDIIGKKCYRVFRDRSEICDKCPAMETFKTLKPTSAEHLLPDEKTVSILACPLLDNKGAIKGVIEIIKDITERKRAEEETKQLKEYLQLQVERMPIGLIVWDTEFHVQSWNPAAEKIFGFIAEEAIGKHPYDLIVPKGAQPHVDDIWRRLLEGDTTAHSVNENITKDGRTIICQWSNTPLKKADGTVVGVLSMVQDITERKRAEETRLKTEEHFRKVIENIFKFVPEGLLVFTDNLNLLKENKVFQDIVQKYSAKLNYTEQELTEIIIEQVKNRIVNEDHTEIRIAKKQG